MQDADYLTFEQLSIAVNIYPSLDWRCHPCRYLNHGGVKIQGYLVLDCCGVLMLDFAKSVPR